MEILFLGGLFPKEKETEIINNSVGGIQNAANNLQWEFVKGLEENNNKPITILNSLYIGSFPKRYKKLKINTYYFSHGSKQQKNINIGFINLTGIKIISRYFSLKPYVRDWIYSKSNSKRIIIAYAMSSTFTQILRYAKQIDDSIITCLIVPDLPQFMNLSNQKKQVYNKLKSIEISIINKNMKYIDSYVLLTHHMRDALKITKPSVVIEGISTDIFSDLPLHDENKEAYLKRIVYTGGLNEKYGIINLVKAFIQFQEDNYRLIICGSGDAESTIRDMSKRDNRIIFKGLLKRNEVLILQKNATVLINPRTNSNEYTKYSFPSKILEYMSSGRPVVACMLDGMPKEYQEYIYVIEDGLEKTIYYTLKHVLEKDENELYEMGKRAKEFALNEKGRKKQCEKIIKMLDNLQ